MMKGRDGYHGRKTVRINESDELFALEIRIYVVQAKKTHQDWMLKPLYFIVYQTMNLLRNVSQWASTSPCVINPGSSGKTRTRWMSAEEIEFGRWN